MHAPHIPENVWWIIAVGTTVLFLAVWLPMMPTSRSKTQIAMIPLVGIIFLTVLGKLRGHDLTKLLSIYSTVSVGMILGVIGRRADMLIAVKQGEDPLGTPASKAAPANKRLTVQLSAGFVVAFALWAWLNWG
ncbi:hypothetical protein [Streptomyces chrestomyceticus]|uniref:hypothetical protein n=1 Tax=Streptomyces chrestomyceticus TaxID=68185 RepID=UPI0019D0B8A1|nr:hypothetical protein [Streptomyces chrestomyceticus]